MKRVLSFFIMAPIISSCSLYESDARKFIREQGIEFRKESDNNLSKVTPQHCYKETNKNIDYDVHFVTSEGEWGLFPLFGKYQLDFYRKDNMQLLRCSFQVDIKMKLEGTELSPFAIANYYVRSSRP